MPNLRRKNQRLRKRYLAGEFTMNTKALLDDISPIHAPAHSTSRTTQHAHHLHFYGQSRHLSLSEFARELYYQNQAEREGYGEPPITFDEYFEKNVEFLLGLYSEYCGRPDANACWGC